MELNREQVVEKFAQVKRIIDATSQAPTIVNEASKFVVVTYWWGRDRLNFNTARPCAEFYESLLDKPTHLLSPGTAHVAKFRTALLRNPKFIQFIDKKIQDYIGVVRAYKMDGKPLSSLYIERSAEDLKSLILDIVLKYVETVIGDIQAFQKLFMERADLEDTFKRRVTAGQTSKAQLDTIRLRLQELKQEKDDILKRIKGGIGPFKSQLDTLLRYSDPVTYDAMITNWETTCRNANCNYLAVEYPEFAAPGGYQLAINAKPRFIQKALELCKGRGVLYIDGDMTVNRYPAIFDMPDIDLMARGWNVDPRSSYMHNESIQVDPYTFETSGGTMFFGQTPEAHLLLQRWIDVSEQYSQWGKADDRILSLVFNTYKLLLPLKVIQLPVEYLWLSLDYDDSIEPNIMDPAAIYLEHPECLTSEETATGQGASSSRTPKFYATIEDTYPRSEDLHEAVMFPTSAATAAFRPYLDYLQKARYFEDVEDESLIDEPAFRVIPFADKFGPFQKIADTHETVLRTLPAMPATNTNNIKKPIVIQQNDLMTIPRILQALRAGRNVIYMPSTASEVYKHSLAITLERFPRIEFAFVNASNDTRRIFFFQSVFHQGEPAFFRAGCPHLEQLLLTCSTMDKLSERFRNGYQFLSRIRTHFLKKYRTATAAATGAVGGAMNDSLADQSEEAMEFLYGTQQKGGRRNRLTRQTNRKTRRRRTKKHSSTRRR